MSDFTADCRSATGSGEAEGHVEDLTAGVGALLPVLSNLKVVLSFLEAGGYQSPPRDQVSSTEETWEPEEGCSEGYGQRTLFQKGYRASSMCLDFRNTQVCDGSSTTS